MTDTYDSAPATRAHQERVVQLMAPIVEELARRAAEHDESKLGPQEKPVFDRFTPRLAETTYGSEEYYAHLREMSGALDHHFSVNRHHPQHFPDGVLGMTLVDLIEMLADWRAAGERNRTGSMERSLKVNADRFSIPDPLMRILRNTAEAYGWLDSEKP